MVLVISWLIKKMKDLKLIVSVSFAFGSCSRESRHSGHILTACVFIHCGVQYRGNMTASLFQYLWRRLELFTRLLCVPSFILTIFKKGFHFSVQKSTNSKKPSRRDGRLMGRKTSPHYQKPNSRAWLCLWGVSSLDFWITLIGSRK